MEGRGEGRWRGEGGKGGRREGVDRVVAGRGWRGTGGRGRLDVGLGGRTVVGEAGLGQDL